MHIGSLVGLICCYSGFRICCFCVRSSSRGATCEGNHGGQKLLKLLTCCPCKTGCLGTRAKHCVISIKASVARQSTSPSAAEACGAVATPRKMWAWSSSSFELNIKPKPSMATLSSTKRCFRLVQRRAWDLTGIGLRCAVSFKDFGLRK